MKIRNAEIIDYAQVMELYQQLNLEDPAVDESEGRPLFETIVESESNFLIVAEVDNCIVSSCYLNIVPNLTRNAKPYAVIENVITHTDYRKKGIGKAVVRYAIKMAWENACYKVMLLTGRKEESTLKFYKACGFESGIKTAFIVKRP